MGAGLHFINTVASDKNILVDTEINMTYSNCQSVLAVLGYQLDGEGSLFDLPVAELKKSAELYLTSDLGELVDQGTPTTQDGIVIHCGRSVGYITGRVQEIKFACEEAQSKGATHAYFC